MGYIAWGFVFLIPWIVGWATGRWLRRWEAAFFSTWIAAALLGFWAAGSGLLPDDLANALAVRLLVGLVIAPMLFRHGYRLSSQLSPEMRRLMR